MPLASHVPKDILWDISVAKNEKGMRGISIGVRKKISAKHVKHSVAIFSRNCVGVKSRFEGRCHVHQPGRRPAIETVVAHTSVKTTFASATRAARLDAHGRVTQLSSTAPVQKQSRILLVLSWFWDSCVLPPNSYYSKYYKVTLSDCI
jgi:hypothetical protein